MAEGEVQVRRLNRFRWEWRIDWAGADMEPRGVALTRGGAEREALKRRRCIERVLAARWESVPERRLGRTLVGVGEVLAVLAVLAGGIYVMVAMVMERL